MSYSLADADSLAEAIYTAIGSASVCWDNPPHGVFNAQHANEIGAALLDYIFTHYVPVKVGV